MTMPVLENTALGRIGVGTAQFGLDYGVSNDLGKTPLDEVQRILETAISSGVHTIDTAHLYGEAESALGQTLPDGDGVRIVTKTPQFGRETRISQQEGEHLVNAFEESLKRLGRDSVHALLIHSTEDLLKPGGERLWDAMCLLQDHRKVKKIGVSVYNADQIDRLSGRFGIELVQVPANVFDQRLFESGHLRELKRQRIEVHARSAYLQGLLLMQPDAVPGYLRWARTYIERFQAECCEMGMSPLDACIDFAVTAPFIDYTIVGVCTLKQFTQLSEAVSKVGVRPRLDYSRFSITDERILNPSRWDRWQP